MERTIEKICNLIGKENLGYLGSGCFGEAYELSDDKVLKSTTDINEVFACYNLLDKENNHLVKIDNIFLIDNQHYILMEKVSTGKIDDLFGAASSIIDENNESIETISIEDYTEYEEIINFVNSIQNGLTELRQNGIDSYDLNEGNIGYSKNKGYVLYDQRVNSVSEEEINNMNIELLKRMNLSGKILNDVSLENVLFDENAFKKAVESMNQGFFDNNEKIEGYINDNSEIVIVSGFKNIINKALTTYDDIKLTINITFDQRMLDSNILSTKTITPDTDSAFLGIDEIINDNELNDLLEKLNNHKKQTLKTAAEKLNKNAIKNVYKNK